MCNFTVLLRFCFALTFFLNGGICLAKSPAEDQRKHRPLSLYLTHGYSHIHNHQLDRLSIGDSAFAASAGAGLHMPSGIGLDLEVMALSSSRRDSGGNSSRYMARSTTLYQQQRLALGGSFRFLLSPHFVLFPEGGVSVNKVRVGLSEYSYSQKDSAKAFGWYLGAGAVIPIRRVFFDIRTKYSVVDLKMDALGVDSPVYQTTVLVGFGFVI